MESDIMNIYKGSESEWTTDNNINFGDFCNLIVDLGFSFKGEKGSHKSYYHNGINERMTIQNANSKAKGYQVRQLRDIIIKHGL